VRRRLRFSKTKHTLVGAATDPSALGALRAFQEMGRAAECAVVGQNAEPEGRAELRESDTRLIGSVAYFPEKYGPNLIRLALDILEGKPTPPAVFTKHQLITRENVDHFYPNDSLMSRRAPRLRRHRARAQISRISGRQSQLVAQGELAGYSDC
jgi:ribose transport system substrate-binding protein